MNINFTLISQAVAFSVFIWFTVKFVWPPLLRAIEERQKLLPMDWRLENADAMN